ncbi:hypothetical protein SKAU_G00087450 [Synaphobranchus kaupii]|uniref:Uncharacterized protein n=1 Tax=Synaphobranchus kaupii TaxID=118154 RepID=A0A9Q1J527_SYNKA|nr:hypothetical protein SKAU_G00087450 [Synaphobranchus kaupii]
MAMFHIVEFVDRQEVEQTTVPARLKLPQAETNTDLQTAEEEDENNIPKKKRKKKPSIRFESDSDDEFTVKQTSKLPPAPKIKGPGFAIQSAIKKQMTNPEP